MRLALNLSLASVAALLLASSGSARADSTYNIATTTSFFGNVSGSLTGTEATLTGFDVTATAGATPFTFDSADAGDSGSFTYSGDQNSSGTDVYLITLANTQADFYVPVTGNFTTGLVYAGDQGLYRNGILQGGVGSAQTVTQGVPVTSDNVSLTLQTTAPATTPEPSSWLLLATGLTGLSVLAMKRRQLS